MVEYKMELRRHKRAIVSLQGEIIVNDTRYASSIENLSDEGAYIVMANVQAAPNFSTDTCLELRFSLPSGEKISLHCKVKWLYQNPPHGYTNSLGLEIMEKPPEYNEALKTLL